MKFESFGLLLVNAFGEKKKISARLYSPAAGVYLPEGRHPVIPFSQHSIIPIVSAAN